jgi:hypothetical protein
MSRELFAAGAGVASSAIVYNLLNNRINRIESQLPPTTEASYIVLADDGVYRAKNGKTGQIEISDTDATKVIKYIINRITAGKIYFKRGTYILTSTVTRTTPPLQSIELEFEPGTVIRRSSPILMLDLSVTDAIKMHGKATFDGGGTGQYSLVRLWGNNTAKAFIGDIKVYNTGGSLPADLPAGVYFNDFDDIYARIHGELVGSVIATAAHNRLIADLYMKNTIWGFYDNQPNSGKSIIRAVGSCDAGYNCVADLANHSDIDIEFVCSGNCSVSYENFGYDVKNINIKANVRNSRDYAAVHVMQMQNVGSMRGISIEVVSQSNKKAVEIIGHPSPNPVEDIMIRGVSRDSSDIHFELRHARNADIDIVAINTLATPPAYGIFIGHSHRVNLKAVTMGNQAGVGVFNDIADVVFKDFVLRVVALDGVSLTGVGGGLSNILVDGVYSSLSIYGAVLFLRNSGTATLAAGSTRVTVNHGLAATPTKVLITPRANVAAWVENITATSFDIVVATPPASPVTFSWYAEI